MAHLLELSKGLQNFTHPRTDAVVIMIAIDETGDKILLGRGVRHPLRRLAVLFLQFCMIEKISRQILLSFSWLY